MRQLAPGADVVVLQLVHLNQRRLVVLVEDLNKILKHTFTKKKKEEEEEEEQGTAGEKNKMTAEGKREHARRGYR